MSSETRAKTGRVASNSGGGEQTVSKPRSCVTCRTRKVRCDKKVPCSNCRRGKIACVLPADDKQPRWARRLERVSITTGTPSQSTDPAASQVMDRIRGLEGLVKQFGHVLQHNRPSVSEAPSPLPNYSGRPGVGQSPSTGTASTPGASSQFGRFVSTDTSQGRYVSSAFWSRISDEVRTVNGLIVMLFLVCSRLFPD